MPSYDLYFDQKVTVWNRTTFTVEAPALDVAVAILASNWPESNFLDHPHIEVGDTEVIYENEDELSLAQNNGEATQEILTMKAVDNVPKYTVIWHNKPINHVPLPDTGQAGLHDQLQPPGDYLHVCL